MTRRSKIVRGVLYISDRKGEGVADIDVSGCRIGDT
jgi:hypothetical protein